MAAISSATTTTTSPTHNHGQHDSWGYSGAPVEDPTHDEQDVTHFDQPAQNVSSMSRNHSAFNLSQQSGPEIATRKMHSVDNLAAARRDGAGEGEALSPPLPIESRSGRASPAEWPMQTHNRRDEQKRRAQQQSTAELSTKEKSHWIHRDKLARIENEELQAAGIFVPRSRAPSKQRRDRSQSRLRRGTETSEQNQPRSRKNSTTVEQRTQVVAIPSWDLRTPEEIAEEEANAYFTSNSLMGNSRIPVAKTSPAPIPLDYLERGSTTSKKLPESPEDDAILYNAKTRSRSASINGYGAEGAASLGAGPAAKRSATDMSPKKAPGARKSSTTARTPPPMSRPKTRSGSNSGTRPPTRSGDVASNKHPEGDPPWIVDAYKPDPRLPPDQQLLPTVAKRLRQEQWEKEGKFGDVYDKDFRPLNDKALLQPPEADKGTGDDPDKQAQQQEKSDEWPLRPDSAAAKSPAVRQGSYSTMPKISDSPRTPGAAQMPNQHPPQERLDDNDQRPADGRDAPEEKGGCGCCVVM